MKTDYNPSLLVAAMTLLLHGAFLANDLLAEPLQNDPGSKTEVQPGPGPFSMHDSDGDGSLSREEYRLFIEYVTARRETTGRPMRRFSPPLQFEEIDTNGDGYISEDEMVSALNKRLQKHRRYRKHGGRW